MFQCPNILINLVEVTINQIHPHEIKIWFDCGDDDFIVYITPESNAPDVDYLYNLNFYAKNISRDKFDDFFKEVFVEHIMNDIQLKIKNY